jgi:glutathione peroxidase-family protein
MMPDLWNLALLCVLGAAVGDSSFYSLEAKSIDGKIIDFGDNFREKLVIVATVPTYYGKTENSTRVARHYLQLARIKSKLKPIGLEVVLFPSDEFGTHRVPVEAKQIKHFVGTCGWMDWLPEKDVNGQKIQKNSKTDCVDLKVMQPVTVNGPLTHPVYEHLKAVDHGNDIEWPLFSYFIIDFKGKVHKETLIHMDAPQSFNNSPGESPIK